MPGTNLIPIETLQKRLQDRLAPGWIIYEGHWSSHYEAVFYVMKGPNRTGIYYHGATDSFNIPSICRATAHQTRLFG